MSLTIMMLYVYVYMFPSTYQFTLFYVTNLTVLSFRPVRIRSKKQNRWKFLLSFVFFYVFQIDFVVQCQICRCFLISTQLWFRILFLRKIKLFSSNYFSDRCFCSSSRRDAKIIT